MGDLRELLVLCVFLLTSYVGIFSIIRDLRLTLSRVLSELPQVPRQPRQQEGKGGGAG